MLSLVVVVVCIDVVVVVIACCLLRWCFIAVTLAVGAAKIVRTIPVVI